MYIYILDSGFRKSILVDDFVSAIWTERYSEAGDVTLVIPSNSKHLSSLYEGIFLSIPSSREVMLIDTRSTEGGLCTLTGSTMTKFLAQRILRNNVSTLKQAWSMTGVPGVLAGTVVNAMCINGGLMDTNAVISNGDKEAIPHLILGPMAGGDSVIVSVNYGNVYDGVKQLCDLDDLGFLMYPANITDTDYDLIFTTYAGKDRTSSQSEYAVVIFEAAVDSFTNIKELRSNAGYKTVAYVWPSGVTLQSQLGVAYAPGTYDNVGFYRRTLMVDASDINVDDYKSDELNTVTNQKARDALANNNYVRLTDGQIVPQNIFKYGTSYNMGDIIELRNKSNVAQRARVTEYIRTEDENGELAYPTLSVLE